MHRALPSDRHTVAALSLVLLGLSGIVPPPAAAAETGANLGAVAADGKLTVLYADVDTPFLDQGPGGPSGFDYDVLQGFAARHGLTVALVPVGDAAELIPALRAGRGEVIAGGFTHTPERAREVLFTGEVTPQRHVVATLAPAAAVKSLTELRQLAVGTVGGTSWDAAARGAGLPEGKLDASLPLDGDALVGALREKRVDAVVTGLFYGLFMARAEPQLRLGLLLGEPGFHGYATLPQHRELRDALDAYLTSVRDSAGWYRIVIKHFGKDAPELFRRARTG